MAAVLDRIATDPPGSAFQSHAIAQLAGPYAGGATETVLALRVDGRCSIDWTARFPLVVASLKRDLGPESLRLAPTFSPGGAQQRVLPPAMFAARSETGATVPVYAPQLSGDATSVPGFELELAGESIAADGAVTALTPMDLGELVELRVVEGALGRLLYLLGQEDTRIRRVAREIAFMRNLDTARDDALDRLGAEVGVERRYDEIVYDAERKEILARRFTAAGDPVRESDAAYARRLRIYRPFGLATRPRVEHALNIDGGHPIRLLEADNRFAIAIQLVSVGPVEFRDRFISQLRIDRLVWPADSAAANAMHAGRFLGAAQLAADQELRVSLRKSFVFADDAALAPHLARALDRAGRLARAVGFNDTFKVTRAQDSVAGSRYQLGLGIDIAHPTAAAAEALRTLLTDAATPLPAQPELRTLAEAARAADAPTIADDPQLAWFWNLCGIQTVHRVDANTVYLSHFPGYGLAISAAPTVAPGVVLPLEARYHAPGDPGANVVLVEGIAAALKKWTDAGNAAWTELSDIDAQARWATAPARATGSPFIAILQGAGLPAVLDPLPVVSALNQLPGELVQTLILDAAFSASILGGDAGAIARLRDLVGKFQDQGISSMLPLISAADEVMLVLATTGLPQAGVNLADRRATGFRWYATPVGQPATTAVAASIKAIGSRSTFTAREPGLYAVVTLGYARRGLTDPYEIRVELPDQALLDVGQYEFLMNFLEHMCPIGVEINTFKVRRQHVDLDGDAVADALPPTISRTYRAYRSRRRLGGYEAEPEQS